MSFALKTVGEEKNLIFSSGIVAPNVEITESLIVPAIYPGANSSIGSLYYDSSAGGIKIYNGSSWVASESGSAGPAFHAYQGTYQTGITNQVIRFDQKEFDTANAFDTTNYRWTPGVAGYYNINATVWFQLSSGSGDVYFQLRKNDSPIRNSSRFSTSGFMPCNLNTIVYLSDADYVDIRAVSSATVQTQQTFGAGNNDTSVYFGGYFIRE